MPSWGCEPAQVRLHLLNKQKWISPGRERRDSWPHDLSSSVSPSPLLRYPSDRLLRLLLHEQHHRRGARRPGLWQGHHCWVQARRQAQRGDGGTHAGVQQSPLRRDLRHILFAFFLEHFSFYYVQTPEISSDTGIVQRKKLDFQHCLSILICKKYTSPLSPCSAPCCTPAAAAKGVSASTTWRWTAVLSWLTSTVTVRLTQSSTSSLNTVRKKIFLVVIQCECKKAPAAPAELQTVDRHLWLFLFFQYNLMWSNKQHIHLAIYLIRMIPGWSACLCFCVAAFRGILSNPTKAVRDTLVNQCAQILACYRKNCASPSSAGQVLKTKADIIIHKIT